MTLNIDALIDLPKGVGPMGVGPMGGGATLHRSVALGLQVQEVHTIFTLYPYSPCVFLTPFDRCENQSILVRAFKLAISFTKKCM